MFNYKLRSNGALVEAKQLDDHNAVRLSVWLDHHQVPNTIYLSSPDLGVGKDDDISRATPGMWIGVIPSEGFLVLADDDFQKHFEEVDE